MSREFNHIFNDEQLIIAISKGNDRAFDQLFRSTFSSLALYAYSITGDTAASEDIAQESFIKLWKARHTLTEVKNLKSFLYKIAYHECMNWLTKKQNKNVVSLDTVNEIPAGIDTEKHIIIAETIGELHRVIELLSPRVKQVFRLYYIEGRSTEEISKLLHTSIKTVMNQRKSALKIIRKTFIPG